MGDGKACPAPAPRASSMLVCAGSRHMWHAVLGQGSRSNVGTGVRTLGLTPHLARCWNVLTPHLARCWNVLTPPSRGLLCVALYISQKQPKRCNSLHEKPKYGSKLSQNCHIELRNCHLELKTLTFPYLDALPSFLAVRSSTVEHRSNTSFCQVLGSRRIGQNAHVGAPTGLV